MWYGFGQTAQESLELRRYRRLLQAEAAEVASQAESCQELYQANKRISATNAESREALTRSIEVGLTVMIVVRCQEPCLNYSFRRR